MIHVVPITFDSGFYKVPGQNYVALKTPFLHGKQSECGAKVWQYYSPKDIIFDIIRILKSISILDNEKNEKHQLSKIVHV